MDKSILFYYKVEADKSSQCSHDVPECGLGEKSGNQDDWHCEGCDCCLDGFWDVFHISSSYWGWSCLWLGCNGLEQWLVFQYSSSCCRESMECWSDSIEVQQYRHPVVHNGCSKNDTDEHNLLWDNKIHYKSCIPDLDHMTLCKQRLRVRLPPGGSSVELFSSCIYIQDWLWTSQLIIPNSRRIPFR